MHKIVSVNETSPERLRLLLAEPKAAYKALENKAMPEQLGFGFN